jgi:hypothetical protein
VAIHRGGSLPLEQHRQLAAWAADCAERVLALFIAASPQDQRPALALETAHAWVRGEATVGEARASAVAAHAAARSVPPGPARDAARAAGHAVATAHMADHALGAAVYALKAIKADAGADRMAVEQRWQAGRLPEAMREWVLPALADKLRLIH